jgi:hypothetical protein
MTHATDSELLAFHDGEIEGPALAELRDHLASCAQCTGELAELRRMSELLGEALARMDVPAPAPGVRPAAAFSRTARRSARPHAAGWWLGSSSLAKAAMLVLALTGVLTAIPGSPTRRVVELLIARLFDRAPAPAVAPAPVAPPVRRELSIDPAAGQVRVLVHGARDVEVTVRLVDAAKASVETSAVDQVVRWISAAGRAEIFGLEAGTLRIWIPRDVRRGTVEFDGRVLVRLRDGVLHLEGGAGEANGDEVSFRISA